MRCFGVLRYCKIHLYYALQATGGRFRAAVVSRRRRSRELYIVRQVVDPGGLAPRVRPLMIIYLELRGDIATREKFFVQQEAANIDRMVPHIEAALRAHTSPTSDVILQKTVQSITETATGRLLESPNWKYGLAIDDIIARVHDIDPELEWNKRNPQAKRTSLEVARFFSWLSRDRRISLGKRIISKCEAARDGEPDWFRHVQPSRGTACVYLVTSQSRPERIKFLQALVSYAYTRPGMRQCMGVATEPIGKGRSYDFFAPQAPPSSDVLARLKKEMPDPFPPDEPLAVDQR